MENFKYEDKWKYLSSGCLNITNSCNLACRYCFVEQQPHFMSLQTAKDAVDFYHKNLLVKKEHDWVKQDHKCHITFFGGEPTLLFDEIIVPLMEYINKTYLDDFTFSITTNGTLLNEDRIKFLHDNHISVLLSCDGKAETQNYNRPCRNGESSFTLIEKNIDILLKYFPNLLIRPTVYHNTAKNLYDNYLWAESRGFKHFHCVPDVRNKWTQEEINSYIECLNNIGYHILSYFSQNQYPKMRFIPLEESFKRIKRIENCNSQNLFLEKRCDRCGLGTTSGSIDYKGRIYGCQEQDSRYGTNDIFYIGDIYNGINVERHNALLSKYMEKNIVCENSSRCESCFFKPICNTYCCPSTGLDLFHNFYQTNELQCITLQTILMNAITIIKYSESTQNTFFKQYLYELLLNLQLLKEE